MYCIGVGDADIQVPLGGLVAEVSAVGVHKLAASALCTRTICISKSGSECASIPAAVVSGAGDAQAQALEFGAKVAGCTVHFVDEVVDHGAIIVQRAVPVLDDDTVESLSARVLEQEHIAYPEAIARVLKRNIPISAGAGRRATTHTQNSQDRRGAGAVRQPA